MSGFFSDEEWSGPAKAAGLAHYKVTTTYESSSGLVCLPYAHSGISGSFDGVSEGDDENDGDGQAMQGPSQSSNQDHVAFVSIHDTIVYRTITVDAESMNSMPQVPSPATAQKLSSSDAQEDADAILINTRVKFFGPQKDGSGKAYRVTVAYRYATSLKAGSGLTMPTVYEYLRDPQITATDANTPDDAIENVHSDYGNNVDPAHPDFNSDKDKYFSGGEPPAIGGGGGGGGGW